MAIQYNPVYKTSDGNIDYSKYVPGLELLAKNISSMFNAAHDPAGGNASMLAVAENARNRFIEYINNPNSSTGLNYEKLFFESSIQNYAYRASIGSSDANEYKQAIEKQSPYFVNVRKLPVKDVQTEIHTNVNKGIQSAKDNYEKKQAKRSWFDKVLGIVSAVGIGVATGGIGAVLATELGVSAAAGEAIVSATLGLAQGKSAQDIVKGIIGSVAAGEVSGALKSINAEIVKAGPDIISPEISAALVNAERQAASAAITGQDIGKAALAGASGGAVASATSLASDNAAIQRAAGEYAQALAAGKTQEQALTSALSGFINQSEKDAAKQKVLDASKNNETAGLTADQVGASTGNQAGGTKNDPTKSLTPVTVTGSNDSAGAAENLSLINISNIGSDTGVKTLPKVTVTANAESSNVANNLSTSSTTNSKDSQTTSKPRTTDNAVLLSLLNRPLTKTTPTRTNTGGPLQTNVSPGSAALAQALRVGDAGAPVLGGDKDKSKRSGWNTESLRYMGNSGDSNE